MSKVASSATLVQASPEEIVKAILHGEDMRIAADLRKKADEIEAKHA
jgi:hypothetical protein